MRAANRAVATVVALLLLVVCVVVVVEIVAAALGQPPWVVEHPTLAEDLSRRTWTDAAVRATCVVLTLVGLLLLVVGLRRSAPTDVELESGASGVRMTVARRSLEQYLAGAAAAETGVADASASVSRGRVTVHADTGLREPGDLKKRVYDAVAARVEALRPAQSLATTVTVRKEP